MQASEPGRGPGASSRRSVPGWVAPVAGGVLALLAVAFCGHAVVTQWPRVRAAFGSARPGWLVAALLLSAAAMAVLGLSWWRCLRVYGHRVGRRDALAWFFAGELGKYVPGGIWPVVGRGELAWRRGGIDRSVGYVTTLVTYAAMTVAAAATEAALAGFAVAGGAPGWSIALAALFPLGVLAVHPRVLGRLLGVVRRRRGDPPRPAPTWPAVLRLGAWSVPAWVGVGLAAVAVTEALGLDQHPARVAFAAVTAWLVGFLAVPVPAGAGVREAAFVLLAGLPSGPAVAVAALTRGLLVLVDAGGGLAGLLSPGRRVPAD